MDAIVESHGAINEAMRFGQGQLLIRERTDDRASTLSAEINSEVIVCASHELIQMEIFFQLHERFIRAGIRIYKRRHEFLPARIDIPCSHLCLGYREAFL